MACRDWTTITRCSQPRQGAACSPRPTSTETVASISQASARSCTCDTAPLLTPLVYSTPKHVLTCQRSHAKIACQHAAFTPSAAAPRGLTSFALPRALVGIQIAPLVHHRGWGRGRSRRERAAAGREGARDAAAKRSEPREAATADHKARSLMVSAHEDTVQTRCWRHTSPFYHLCTQNDRRTKPIYYEVAILIRSSAPSSGIMGGENLL